MLELKMPKKLRAGAWKGAWYLRNKQTDKHGNKYRTKETWRNVHSNVVVDKYGNFLGFEKNLSHHYSRDERGKKPKNFKKPTAFVRQNRIGSLKPRQAHIRNL